MGWRAIARSAVGTSHLKRQMPCQDFGGYRFYQDVIVGAVADGAGSAKYAEIGAELAVKTALRYLTGTEAGIEQYRRFWKLHLQPFSEEEAWELFTETAKQVIAALEAQAASQGASIADLACTLLVFMATPKWVAAMQIGDGFIMVRCQQAGYQLLFSPDKGEYINETTFITSANAVETMQVCVRWCQPEFICAATDGLERVAICMSDWIPFAPFFQPLEGYLRQISDPEQEDEYLMRFLESDKLNDRTDDDKTLLLCCYDSPNLQRLSSRAYTSQAER